MTVTRTGPAWPAGPGLGVGVVVQDRAQIGLGEAGVDRGVPQRPVHVAGPDRLRGRDGLGHFDPRPGGARCCGRGQPHPRRPRPGRGTRPPSRYRPWVSAPAPRRGRVGSARRAWPDCPGWRGDGGRARPARCPRRARRPRPPPRLGCAPAPTRSARAAGGAPSTPRPARSPSPVFTPTVRVTPNDTVRGAAGSGCSRARCSTSMSIGARRVTRCTRALTVSGEHRARLLQLDERGVLLAQVGVLGDQIGLGEFHRRLRPALACRIRRLTGVHPHRVVPGNPTVAGLRTAIPATCSMVTVFSLSRAHRSVPHPGGAA